MKRRLHPMLAALILLWAGGGAASDHRDAPLIDEDPTVDLTDLFVFPSREDPARTVLALAVNPFTIAGVNAFFSPAALYELRIDNDGDTIEDLVIQTSFAGTGRAQTFEVRGPAKPARTGATTRILPGAAVIAGATNESLQTSRMRAFAGLRDDPFFFDQPAFFVEQHFRKPGVDFYAGKNVSAIVVEVPTAALAGSGPALRVWASAYRLVGGKYVQEDRLGLPAANVVLVPPAARDEYNQTSPREDAKLYGAGLKQTLEALGLDAAARDGLAAALQPDVLTYDPAKPAGFLNGRRPEDDVIDAVLGLLASKGAAVPTDPGGKPSDNVGENDVPFLQVFPYLAPPHAAK